MPFFPNVLAIMPVALLTVTASQALAQRPTVTVGRDAAPNNEMNP